MYCKNRLYSIIIKTDFCKRPLLCNKAFTSILYKNFHEAHDTIKEHKSVEINSLRDHEKKLLKVAIIGIPNAGKSTLVNSLIDRRVIYLYQI